MPVAQPDERTVIPGDGPLHDSVLIRDRTASLLLRSARPKQWIKNGFVLVPLLFSERFTSPSATLLALSATACFCLTSSAVYLLNDVLDRELDRAHPVKRYRPVAAGTLAPRTALLTASALGLCALAGALAIDVDFALVLGGYAGLMLLYTFVLKHHVLVDVVTIAAGFVLRVIAGAAAIDVEASVWLLLCMGLVALLLALGKRRGESRLLAGDAAAHRAVLAGYGARHLDAMILVIAAATVGSYGVYTAIGRAAEHHLAATIPFVLCGVGRYLWLVFHHDQGDSPTDMAWTDRILIATVAVWALTTGLLLTL